MRRIRSWGSGQVLPTFSLVLLTFLSIPLSAQVGSSSNAEPFLKYESGREITLSGTVQEVVTKHEAGNPAGLRLVIAGPQGPLDAHLGPYVPADARAALQEGTAVQAVGVMGTLHGKNVLLVRQLVFSGRTLTLRNAQGFLVRPGGASHKPITERNESKGGSL